MKTISESVDIWRIKKAREMIEVACQTALEFTSKIRNPKHQAQISATREALTTGIRNITRMLEYAQAAINENSESDPETKR